MGKSSNLSRYFLVCLEQEMARCDYNKACAVTNGLLNGQGLGRYMIRKQCQGNFGKKDVA